MEPAVAGAMYGVEKVVEGAVALAKGVYDPTLPLKAAFRTVAGVNLARAGHSLTVVKGRAYIFGGVTSYGDVEGEVVSNDMHVVILPATELQTADYRVIAARPAQPKGKVPSARVGHTAVAVGNFIYVVGGCASPGSPPLDETVIWAFDTFTNTWDALEPAPASPFPPARHRHATAACDEPEREIIPSNADIPPQVDRAATTENDPIAEPVAPHSNGTIFVSCGMGASEKLLDDVWAFDLAKRTWSSLPAPGIPCHSHSMAYANGRLFIGLGITQRAASPSSGTTQDADLLDLRSLELTTEAHVHNTSPSHSAAMHIMRAAKPSWSNIPAPVYHHAPAPRHNGCLIPVTTGQGRTYLLLMGGAYLAENSSDPSTGGTGNSYGSHADAWVLQLPSPQPSNPVYTFAATLKDRIRSTINKPTDEWTWAPILETPSPKSKQNEGQGEGIVATVQAAVDDFAESLDNKPDPAELRLQAGWSGFAADATGTEVDGANAILWGGWTDNAQTKICAEGVLVSIEI